MNSLFCLSLFVLISGSLSLPASASETPTAMSRYYNRGSLFVELDHVKWLKERIVAPLPVTAEVAWSAGLPQRLKLRLEYPLEWNVPHLPLEIGFALSTESLQGIYSLHLESPPPSDFFLKTSGNDLRVGSFFGTVEVKNKGRVLIIRPSEAISLGIYQHPDHPYVQTFVYKASGDYCLAYSRYWACRKKKSAKNETELIKLRLTSAKIMESNTDD